MKTLRTCLLIAVVVTALVIPALWYLAVPLEVLTSRVKFTLGGTEAQILVDGLSKGIPFTVTADRLTLRGKPDQTRGVAPEIVCTSLEGRIPWGGLFSLSPRLDFSCTAYGGKVSGTAGMTPAREAALRGEGISLGETPFASLYGLRGKGSLSFDYKGSPGSGDLTFLISDARIESSLVPESFPLRNFRTIRGALDIRDRGADVRSLTLESPGIFARIKGRVGEGAALVIELMIDSPSALDPVYARALDPYAVSPGYWSIPFDPGNLKLR